MSIKRIITGGFVLLLILFFVPVVIALILGDTNGDGKVDGIDYMNIILHYGQTTSGGVAVGDVNNDGKVDITDLNIVTSGILNPITITPTPTPISVSPTPTGSPVSGTNFYVDGTNGSDTNPGTIGSPWKTLQKAIVSITPGSTLNIRKGVYLVPRVTHLSPAGPDKNHKTTFKAYQNADGSYEHVIFTLMPYTNSKTGVSYPGYTPSSITMENNVRVEGMILGGARDADTANGEGLSLGGNPIGDSKEIVNCTILGSVNGLISGSTQHAFIENNNFIHTGGDNHWHSVYISGQDNAPSVTGVSNNNVVDHNVFVGTPGVGAMAQNIYGYDGYAMQSWHDSKRSLYSRNFVADKTDGAVAQDSDMFIINNYFYNMKTFGSTGTSQGWGLLASSSIHSQILNNIFAYNAPVNNGGYALTEGDVISNNAFWPHLASYGGMNAVGSNQIQLHAGSEATELGVSNSDLDAAISAVQTTFMPASTETNQQFIYRLLDDPNVDTSLRHLRSLVMGEPDVSGFIAPLGTAMNGNGLDWFGNAQPNGLSSSSKINLGPRSQTPGKGTFDDFMTAFNTYGPNFFMNWDRCDNSYTPGGQPICP